jgi:hypothetical protein
MIRFLICFVYTAAILFAFIGKIHELNVLRLQVPDMEKQVRRIQKENDHIAFQLQKFSHPAHLMEYLQQKEYAHLTFPKRSDHE